MSNFFYITTPIYYVNDIPHIGHAYTTLACDVMARFMRLDGKQVKFLTGTDEHGQKVEKSAKAKGVDPQAFTDEVSQRFRELTDHMQFSNDDFIRTTEQRHKDAAQAMWKRLQDNGHIYLGSYSGWYSVRDETFYNEDELVEGKAPTGADVEWVEEPSYFFDLSKWQDKLLELYESQPDFILPKTRRNEVISFVKGGLTDLSISRTSFKWGVPVPGDDDHIMYVWLDALTNYLAAVDFPNMESKNYTHYWEQPEHSPLHVVGKDILRFHAIYWPAFLMAADLPLPKRIVAHGWWTNEGQKISKSIGNVIDPLALIEEFGLDSTRYFLMREVPFGSDGNFSRNSMVTRINAELANNVGNLVQRTLSMINKNCDGNIPDQSKITSEDKALWQFSREQLDAIRKDMADQQFHLSLEKVVAIASKANEYIDIQAPWVLKKENPERMQAVLYTLAETIRYIGILLQPFMPSSASKILDQLAVADDARTLAACTEAHALVTGTDLPKPEGVFPRFVEAA